VTNNKINLDTLLAEINSNTPNYLWESAWLEHGSFMMWLVKKTKPHNFVELGSHYGFSYFAACQAIAENNLNSKAYAIDTWQGDSQAGIYNEEVYEHVNKHNFENYSKFSKLIRSTFDEALTLFENGSIDLLHIDGFHTYEAVSHDFNTWKTKLSENAIVVFHDIHEFADGFGVYKFWAELKEDFQTFEFKHGHGLGILKYGKNSSEIDFIFNLNQNESELIQNLVSAIGARKTLNFQLELKNQIIEKYYVEFMNYKELLQQKNEEIEKLSLNIRDIKKSFSWKITTPLRNFRRLLKNPK